MDNPDWILQFQKPSPKIIAKIETLLQGLDIEETLLEDNDRQKGDDFCGTLPDCIKTLSKTLESDYNKNSLEASGDGYRFDYIVSKDANKVGTIRILTRLFSDNKSGNIYYGRLIVKIAEDKFLLWIDD